MVRYENFVSLSMIASICFGIKGIPNQDTLDRATINLGIVLILDKDEHATADLAQMRKVWLLVSPTLKRSMAVLGGDWCFVR